METKISVEVLRDKSFDPNFQVRISYDDGKTRFKNEVAYVSRKPPRVNIEYTESVEKVLDKIERKKLELEIMRAIVEVLLNNSGKRL
ncbi:MAG: hypothetical protein N2376_12070 [Clostridia bacterium]|nr:hypothetical protein [Clostridia bacterium]